MNHTLIANNTTYGAGATGALAGPASLLAGAIGAFGFDKTDSKFKLVTPTTVGNFKEITFYLGLGGGKVLQGATQSVGMNCTAVMTPFEDSTESVYVLSNFGVPEKNENCCHISKPAGYLKIGEDIPNFMNYGNVYYADAGGVNRATATPLIVRDAIFDQLVEKFAMTGEAVVTKTTTNTLPSITITFANPYNLNPINPVFKQYYVAADGFLEGLTVTKTLGSLGVGTAMDIVPKEHLDRVYRGMLYTAEAPVYGIYKVPSQYREGTEYDGFYFHSILATADKTGQHALTTTPVYTWIYTPSTSAASGALEDIIDAIKAGPVGPQGPQGA